MFLRLTNFTLSRLYIALSYIQVGRRKAAKHILKSESAYVIRNVNDNKLRSLYQATVNKWRLHIYINDDDDAER